MLRSSDDETAVTDSPTEPTEEPTALEQAPEDDAAETRRFRRLRRRRLLSRVSIQSKLVVMMQAMAEVGE